MEKAFDSRVYKLELYLFNLFVHTHEALFDQEYQPFAEWLRRFEDWRKTPEVKNYIDSLQASPGEVSKVALGPPAGRGAALHPARRE